MDASHPTGGEEALLAYLSVQPVEDQGFLATAGEQRTGSSPCTITVPPGELEEPPASTLCRSPGPLTSHAAQQLPVNALHTEVV